MVCPGHVGLQPDGLLPLGQGSPSWQALPEALGHPPPGAAGFLPVPPVPLAGNGTQGHSKSRLTLAASSVYTPPPRPGLGAWVPGMVENIRSQLHLPSQADALQASGSNNMVWAVDGKPACHAPGPVPSHPPPRLQRLCRNSAAVGGSAWRRWRWGECAWERPRTRSLGASVAGKADESDSVGTSGRKGRESRGISEGTLGLWRLGVGLGCCVRPGQERG